MYFVWVIVYRLLVGWSVCFIGILGIGVCFCGCFSLVCECVFWWLVLGFCD